MPPRSRQLWQLVAFVVAGTALGCSPLDLWKALPRPLWIVLGLIVFGWAWRAGGAKLARRVLRPKPAIAAPAGRVPWRLRHRAAPGRQLARRLEATHRGARARRPGAN